MKKLFPIFLLGIVVFISGCTSGPPTPDYYSEFTTCVTDSGVKEYGAYWCPNCARVKLTLGKTAWNNLDYVECDPKCVPDENGQLPLNIGCIEGHESHSEECLQIGVEKYPSWVKNDQILYVGTDLSNIAEISGCQLPE